MGRGDCAPTLVWIGVNMTVDPNSAAVPVEKTVSNDTVGHTEHVLPLFAEHAEITKTQTISARITVSTVVRIHEEEIDEMLTEEHAEIERVQVGRYVTEAQPIRHEGDVVIVPIIEEVLVIQRRLLLKEEVRIRRKRTTRHHQEVVALRKEEAVVLRRAEGATATAGDEPDESNNTLKENTDVQ
jgi:stress response protein YsnF